jgi:hypothetical protein
MEDKLTYANLMANICTRQLAEGMLYQPRANISMYKSSYTYMAPQICNKLDQTLRDFFPLSNSFKKAYKVKELGQPPKYNPNPLPPH